MRVKAISTIGIVLVSAALLLTNGYLAAQTASSTPEGTPTATTTAGEVAASTTSEVPDVATASTSPELAPQILEPATTADSPAAAVETPLLIEPQPLTLVRIIGTKYIDYFTDGTTITEYAGDPDIDSHFNEPDTPIPSRPGLTWVHTAGQPLYDTPSGDLEVGTYAQQGEGSFIAHYATSTILNATSTPELPARIVTLTEDPVVADIAPESLPEQDRTIPVGTVEGSATTAATTSAE